MKKYEYLSELEKRLSALPEAERRDALNYYEEYFDAAGTENEDATAAEMGDPAEAARKILESEGVNTDNAANADAQPPQTVPAGQEPPAAKLAKRGPKGRTMWLIFAVIIVAALIIQLAVLALSFAKPSGGTVSMTIAEEEAATEPAAESGSTPQAAEGATATVGGGTSKNMDFTTGLADAKNITFAVDYGTVTVVVDSGAAEPTLSCTNLRRDWFTFTNMGDGTSPVYVEYKTPSGFNLGQDLGYEPQFTLTVPDTDTFRLKKLSITTAMGDVEFDNSNTIAADNIDLNLAMGNFTGSTVQAERFVADVSMGNFDLGLLEGVQTAKVEAGMGNIGLTVDGKPDDYALDLQSSMGDVVFNGRKMSSTYTQMADAPRSVTLTASMGDVVLTTTQ